MRKLKAAPNPPTPIPAMAPMTPVSWTATSDEALVVLLVPHSDRLGKQLSHVAAGIRGSSWRSPERT
jgi:hypothetical protein